MCSEVRVIVLCSEVRVIVLCSEVRVIRNHSFMYSVHCIGF